MHPTDHVAQALAEPDGKRVRGYCWAWEYLTERERDPLVGTTAAFTRPDRAHPTAAGRAHYE